MAQTTIAKKMINAIAIRLLMNSGSVTVLELLCDVLPTLGEHP